MSDRSDMDFDQSGVDERDEDLRFVKHGGDATEFSLLHAFRCARCGIAYAFASQRNFKTHLFFACLAIALGFILRVSEAAWFAIVICIAVVFMAELLNTAIESVVDLVSPEWHALAKRAKDCAAGAVYIVAIGSVIVAAFAYIPALLNIMNIV